MKNQTNESKAVREIVRDFRDILSSYSKKQTNSLTRRMMQKIGPDVSAYCTAKGIISCLLSGSEAKTFGSVLGYIRQELDLEFRMKELEDSNAVNKHFFRIPGEPSWSASRRLKGRTRGETMEDLSKYAMVLLEVFLKRYDGDFLEVRLEWRGHRSFRMISLAPSLEEYLREVPVVFDESLTVLPEHAHCGPYLKTGRFGVPPATMGTPLDTSWNYYTIDREALEADYEKLRKGQPSALFRDTAPLSIPEGITAQERGALIRAERSRRVNEVVTRSATRKLLLATEHSDPFRFPIHLDFRGRIYLVSPSSPQSVKTLRPYLRDEFGSPFRYYDMRQSNINLLSLLTTGRLYPSDWYQDLADHMRYHWCSFLEESVGPPTRDLMKHWYSAVFFGQDWLNAYDTAIGKAVRSSPKFTNETREEVKRVFLEGFSKAANDRGFLLLNQTDHLRTPDGWTIPLAYQRQTRKRIMSKFHGQRYETHIEVDSGETDWVRTQRALTANLIHSLDAYILREQLKAVHHAVPIHDCLGVTDGASLPFLAEICWVCVGRFAESLAEQGFLKEAPTINPFGFTDLYEEESLD